VGHLHSVPVTPYAVKRSLSMTSSHDILGPWLHDESDFPQCDKGTPRIEIND